MTSKKIAKDQPKTFVFNNQNQSIIKNILLKYPQNKKVARLCHYYIWHRSNMIIGYLYQL